MAKFKTKIGAFLTAVFAFPLTLIALANETSSDEGVVITNDSLNSEKRGVHGGYDYEFWNQDNWGEPSMTLNEGGAFECSWKTIKNVLFRKGKKLGSEKTFEEYGSVSLEYGCDYEPDGNSYLCVYGWSVDPLIEFYIVESWGSWRPPGGKALGQIEVDGGTYDVYSTERVNQPSIQGKTTFTQYWSVRTEQKEAGTISIDEHMKKWADYGLELGKLYEIAFCVEGYMSRGEANVYKNDLSLGGESVSVAASSEEAVLSPNSDNAALTEEPIIPDAPVLKRDNTALYIALIAGGALALTAGIIALIKNAKKK